MKFIVVIALCLCALELSSAQEIRMKGRRLFGGLFGRAVKLPAAMCTTANAGKFFCNGDTVCESTGVVQCTGNALGITALCPAHMPYCVQSTAGVAECSTQPSDTCPVIVPTFVCTSPGVFPEPSNCKTFYKCNKDAATGDIKPVAYYCDLTNYVFDPNSVTDDYCLYTTTASKCVIANTACAGATTSNVALKYYNNAQYAAICTSNPVEIIQCATGAKVNLNDYPPSCTYTCKGEALYPYSLDDTHYYDCKYDASKKLFATLKACQAPYVKFDKTKCI